VQKLLIVEKDRAAALAHHHFEYSLDFLGFCFDPGWNELMIIMMG